MLALALVQWAHIEEVRCMNKKTRGFVGADLKRLENLDKSFESEWA